MMLLHKKKQAMQSLWRFECCIINDGSNQMKHGSSCFQQRVRYETSQNYRTYGSDPKYAATSIKETCYT